jgi:NADPH-dependent glutamate synthase beta subunit-like oxidoreductase/dihydroorotate dehydrogenase/Pyruvate/2-oxoacid:ferredoxin oxidoreductase delta subunit
VKHLDLFLTDAQLASEIARCVYCEEKPCTEACPADCSPADFIMAAKGGTPADFARSAALIMTKNPLGGVCGAVCPDTHCQAACSRKLFDRAIEIPYVQAAIVARAKALGVMPKLELTPANGKKVAIVGSGAAGLAAALVLAQLGYEVDLLDRQAKAGGAVRLIPAHRMDPQVLDTDIAWLLGHPRVHLRAGRALDEPGALLAQGYAAVLLAGGLHEPIRLGIEGEDLAVPGNAYLADPARWPSTGRVVVVGGGAIACDCATTALARGATGVELITLEQWSELPLTPKERQELLEHPVNLVGRTRVTAVLAEGGRVSGVRLERVALAAGERFHPAKMTPVAGTGHTLPGITQVIVAIGNRAALKGDGREGVFPAGDAAWGPSTVVEASGSGKNAALQLDAWVRKQPAPKIGKPTKGRWRVPGYADVPVPLATDFFGRRIPSPFLLSAAPPTDGYEQMKKALDAGWAGGIMKTAFDGLHIHIPADYMHAFDDDTYGNSDNVSDHTLDRVCREVAQLVKEYPDRLIGASTGGPVSGHDAEDKLVWQANSRKLERAGAQLVEFSLSCPQGGDGTEGAIVSQSAAATAKVIGWIMETGDPQVPKLFKLTGAVTSVEVILRAVKEVLDRYPQKKAGVTLANSFPTLFFRPGKKQAWDEGIVVGMSGAGVAPISNLSLASVGHLGVTVSGNGGPMDYRSAAHFLALGARTVQFCTVAMKYGVGIVGELHSGLSHLMQARGIGSVEELIGRALPDPVTDFMALSPTLRIPALTKELCVSCGNCTRCGYLAVSLGEDRLPRFDATKCIGCSLCAQKCFTGALAMRDRTPDELAAKVAGV